jgi:hypothetical protein
MLAPTSKEQRVITVHAASKKGFIPNALLIIKSEEKYKNFHHKINYERWLTIKLIQSSG